MGDRAAKINIISANGMYLGAVAVSFNKITDKVDNSPVIADLDGDAALEMVTLSDSNLTVMQLSGFSYDWRMRGRDDALGSSLKPTNSHDGARMLEVGVGLMVLPIMAANWTHATDTNLYDEEALAASSKSLIFVLLISSDLIFSSDFRVDIPLYAVLQHYGPLRPMSGTCPNPFNAFLMQV